MATRGQLQKKLWAQKLKVRNYLNFTITFLIIWRCAGAFSKFYLNSKWPPPESTSIFWWAQKLKKLVWSIFFEFSHHIPSSMWMCDRFFKDVTNILNGRQKSTQIFFVGPKTRKHKVVNFSNFTITFPTIWRCACDFFKVSGRL